MSAAGTGVQALHLVLGAETGALDRCLCCCAEGDTILFMDDGVGQLLAANSGDFGPGGVAVVYSGPDLRARGLEGLARSRGVSILPDAGLPALLLGNSHCLSWK